VIVVEVTEVMKAVIASREGGGAEEIELYDHQLKLIEAFRKLVEGDKNVVILRAPCGSGKTEALVIPYLAQFVQDTVSIPRLIYVLPTQTLVYNMKIRFDSYIAALRLYTAFQKHEESLKPDVEHGLDLDPKYFIPRFTVSTYDVLVYAWVARRTIPWRPFTTRGAIASSLVVFDEAHLLQDMYTYSQYVFTSFVEVLSKAAIPVIISSATLSDTIVKEVRDGVGLEQVEEVKASLNSYSKGSVTIEEHPEDAEAIPINEARDKISEIVLSNIGRDVLIVVNSVPVAYDIYTWLLKRLTEGLGDKDRVVEVEDFDSVSKYVGSNSEKVFICLLHGRLPISVRMSREDIFEKLRKVRREGKEWSLIVVATQVAEVGIDYSFDIIISESAPLTATVQRIMRGGRRKGQRSKVYILPPIAYEERVATYGIYGKSLVEYSISKYSELKGGDLRNIDFLSKIATDEAKILEDFTKSENWVFRIIEKAKKLLNASLYLPPLATATHRNTFASFKARLGEYMYLYIVEVGGDVQLVDHVRDVIKKLGKEDIIKNAIKLSINIYYDGESRGYFIEVPKQAIWSIKGKPHLLYLKQIISEEGAKTKSETKVELDVDSVPLQRRGMYLYGPSRRVLEDYVFGKILLLYSIPNLRYKYGLVSYEREKIFTL
jgi:CRISPR-associated endonuclease/helicase Cas3